MNASTIHSAILAAAAVAPEFDERKTLSHSWEMQQRAAHFLTFEVEEANLKTSDEFTGLKGIKPARLDYETREMINWSADQARAAALSELCHCAGNLPPSFVTFQTSERGRMRVCNTRARLLEFAAQVKANQRAFGGGIKPQKRANKPAQVWNPNALKVIREAMQDRLYADALRLAEEKAGALFYPSTSGHQSCGGPSVLLLIGPVDVPELPGLVTAMRANDGAYVVMDPLSGCTVGLSGGSRATAIRNALHHMEQRKVTADSIAAAIARANKVDQAKARADFVAHFAIVDADEAARLAAEAVANAQASAAEECASVEA